MIIFKYKYNATYELDIVNLKLIQLTSNTALYQWLRTALLVEYTMLNSGRYCYTY